MEVTKKYARDITLCAKLRNMDNRLQRAEARCIISKAQIVQTKTACIEIGVDIVNMDVVLDVLLYKISAI